MKNNFQELRNILYHPIYETRVKNAKKWLDKATKELEQLKQKEYQKELDATEMHTTKQVCKEAIWLIDEVLGATK